MNKEIRELGMYLFGVISIMALFGISGGIAVQSATNEHGTIGYLVSLFLVVLTLLGFTAIVSFRVAELILQEVVEK